MENKLPLVNNKQTGYTIDTVSTVRIVSLIDANVTLTGTATGNKYIFPKAGTVVEVDVKDKDEILNKKRGRVCCGQAGALFQLAN